MTKSTISISKKVIQKNKIYLLMLFLIIIVSSLNLRNVPLDENINDNESKNQQLLTENLNSPKFASQWVSPVLLETFYIKFQQFNDMGIWNELAFVAASTQGFYIFDVSNPLNPYIIYHNLSVITYSMTISNNTLFTSSNEGFTSYNISDPINPQVMDRFFLSSGGESAEKAYIVGEIAYVAYSERGLQIVNISNPSNMIRIGFYEEIDADIIDVHVINNLAYVACNAYGMKILNISDPANVQEVGFFNDYSSIKFVYASDDIAYVSFYPEGIVAINVSDPVNPTEIWKYGGIGEFHGMLISNEIAYLSSYSEGFTILNISNPQIPVQISNLYYPPFMAWGIDLYENIIYISSPAGYLYVIDPGFDTDEDNIPNVQEQLVYDLDINDPDCDDDGLIDGDEVSIYGTNPQSNDTDNDLLWDFEEINVYSTNPLTNDTDNDLLWDFDEINVHSTNPLTNDTDNDLLWDFDEINVYSTDPLSNDTDNDLLWDFDEINVYSTDPLSNDTDGDGFNDGIEVAVGTEPNNDLFYPTDGDNYKWQEYNVGASVRHD